MRDYPNETIAPRAVPANPPRRRPNAPPPRRASVDDDADSRADAVSRAQARRTQRHARRRTERVVSHVMTASATLCLLLFIMPFLFTSDAAQRGMTPLSSSLSRGVEAADAEAVAEPEPEPEAVAEPEPAVEAQAVQEEPFVGQLDDDCFLRVLDKQSGGVSEMSMGEYLVCVLRGEMPGYFEQEALKAQAVAARTYTRYMLLSGGKHAPKADICNSPACCQAYLSAAKAKEKWGYLPESEERKIRSAVMDTDGQVMLYDGEPILAVFHASSAGLTLTSGDVWSGDKPYLQPVYSPEPADSIPNYYSRAEFTLNALRGKLRDAFPKANLSGDASGWLTDAVRDDAGNVITLYVGGIKTQGSRVRSALGLRSACFTWEFSGERVIFYVTGHGHGVGLSQYGANQMAADGADYREILTHYYTGVQIGGYTP